MEHINKVRITKATIIAKQRRNKVALGKTFADTEDYFISLDDWKTQQNDLNSRNFNKLKE